MFCSFHVQTKLDCSHSSCDTGVCVKGCGRWKRMERHTECALLFMCYPMRSFWSKLSKVEHTEPERFYSYSKWSSHSITTLRLSWMYAMLPGCFACTSKCIPTQSRWRIRVKSFVATIIGTIYRDIHTTGDSIERNCPLFIKALCQQCVLLWLSESSRYSPTPFSLTLS